MNDLLALATVMVWPVIPLFWIPVHGFPKIFRRLGTLTYLMPALLWPPLAYVVFHNRAPVLHYRFDLPLSLRIAGGLLLAAGVALQVRTGVLLSLRGLMGIPEISPDASNRLVTKGIFSVVRHPTYLSHTMMLAGMFFLTAVAAVGIAAALDFLVINIFVIPLEEKELAARFGQEYIEYRRAVPKFFPRIRGK
ncbi:MAG: isoprenylcysteine carboxylmethyltransferase family protein [Nitrospiraceae bacterium]|nr:isoprenylcysteine carboxylmethyltransferase family protein [Nitrospiraceae bacterium]